MKKSLKTHSFDEVFGKNFNSPVFKKTILKELTLLKSKGESFRRGYQMGRKELASELLKEAPKITFPDFRNEDNRDREAMIVTWNAAIAEISKVIKSKIKA